jgi:multicomponent Na+:H+ antiporter subunit C
MHNLLYVIVIWLLVVGLYGIVTSRNLIHLINCLAVIQSSSYILLLMIGFKTNGTAPVLTNITPNANVVDPVVQALTLTDVVVSAVVWALLLSLAIQTYKEFRTLDPNKLAAMKG